MFPTYPRILNKSIGRHLEIEGEQQPPVLYGVWHLGRNEGPAARPITMETATWKKKKQMRGVPGPKLPPHYIYFYSTGKSVLHWTFCRFIILEHGKKKSSIVPSWYLELWPSRARCSPDPTQKDHKLVRGRLGIRVIYFYTCSLT